MKKIERWFLGGEWMFLYFPGVSGNYFSWRRKGEVPCNAEVVAREKYNEGNLFFRVWKALKNIF